MKKKVLLLLLCVFLVGNFGSFAITPDESILTWPTESTRITDEFGTPRDNDRTHAGIDIGGLTAGTDGDNVWAAQTGAVKYAGLRSYGNTIMINLSSKIAIPGLPSEYVQNRYIHLKTIFCSTGQTKNRNSLIGEMGDSGTPGQVHLHFETRQGAVQDMSTGYDDHLPVDPIIYYSGMTGFAVTPLNVDKTGGDVSYDGGHFGILKDYKLYQTNYILEMTLTEISEAGITASELEDLLAKIKDVDSTSYMALKNHVTSLLQGNK